MIWFALLIASCALLYAADAESKIKKLEKRISQLEEGPRS
jgi:hypothetical protein